MDPATFQNKVWNFFENNKRELPWRKTDDDYKIFVSEIMLQQTQASRVIPKYEEWIEQFPSFTDLKQAARKEVLSAWQGLGYNRRAVYLHQSAGQIVDEHNSKLPNTRDELETLHGVGPYTAGALLAFCFEKPVVFVETNIRTVFLHHFFPENSKISDDQIKEKVEETLPSENIREWYWALMDYGSHIKKKYGNPNKRSKSYTPQSKFSGSNRQLRAKITRFILDNEPVSKKSIATEFQELVENSPRMKDIETNLKKLKEEGFVSQDGDKFLTKKK